MHHRSSCMRHTESTVDYDHDYECDSTRLTLVRFSSVRRAPTSATEPSVQLDLKSGTICRQTSDCRNCYTASIDSRWIRLYLDSGPLCSVNPHPPFNLLTYLFTLYTYIQVSLQCTHVTLGLISYSCFGVAAYNDRVLAFLRQPNVLDVIKERNRSMWSNIQLKNKISIIRSDGISALERFANDVDFITLLRYDRRLRLVLVYTHVQGGLKK